MTRREGRTYGRILVDIWSDDDFVKLSVSAKLMYLALFTSNKITAVGVIAITVNRWARSTGLSVFEVHEALDELADNRFIVLDLDTEEALVRTFVKHDGGLDNPNRTKSVHSAANAVDSPALVGALSREFEKLGVAHRFGKPADDGLDNPSANRYRKGSDKGSDKGSRNPSRNGWGNPPDVGGYVPALQEQPETTTTAATTSDIPSQQPEADILTTSATGVAAAEEVLDAEVVDETSSVRPEVDELCDLLANHVEANGSKRPTVTKRWRDACRLMLDADGRTVDQVRFLIDWSQRDSFWASNVMSMPKLREKFDQLRLRAMNDWERQQAAKAPRRTTDDKVRDGQALAEQLRREEAEREQGNLHQLAGALLPASRSENR